MLSCCRGTGLHWGERLPVPRVGSSCCGARRAHCVLTWPADVRQQQSSSVTAIAAVAGHVSDQAAFTGTQAILDRYRALLSEYRQHKAALADWLSLITVSKHRQAQLLDAEATGDAVLVSRFQQYLMSRKRLLAEIPIMREQLQDAELQQQHQHHSSSNRAQQHKRQHGKAKHSSTSSTGSYGVVNANQASPISKSQAVGQFFAAVNYRTKHRVGEGSAVSSSGTAQPAVQQASQLQPALAPEPSSPTASTPLAAAAATTSSSSSASSSSSSSRAEAVSHLLSAATNSSRASSSSSSSGGRAAAAALAALAYKQQSGSGAAGSSSLGSQQQRPLAIQLAEGPPPPPGYVLGGTGLDGSSSSSSSNVVICAVEIAKADANALRSNRRLDTDVSLEATLQGVPGGLGASDAAMFAATITRPAVDADAAVDSSSSSSADVTAAAAADPVLAAAAAKASSSCSNEPVGEVVTAKFDVYSGRQRVMDPDALDVYFASLAEGHSLQLAAAAALPSSSSSSSSLADSSAVQQQENISSSSSSSSGKANQQRASRRHGGSSGSIDSGLLAGGLGLPGDIIPLPT